MISDEFKPDVGKKLFSEHRAELMQGLRQLAAALGKDRKYPSIADFFTDFMTGFWDPYEEVCSENNQQQKEIGAEIRDVETQLFELAGDGIRPLVDKYGDLLMQRNTHALDYAFLVGYQCAFRFLIMGLTAGSEAFSGKVENT